MGLVDLDNLRLHLVVLNYFRATKLHMGQNCKRVNIDRSVGFEIFVLSYAK